MRDFLIFCCGGICALLGMILILLLSTPHRAPEVQVLSPPPNWRDSTWLELRCSGYSVKELRALGFTIEQGYGIGADSLGFAPFSAPRDSQ